MLTKESLTKEIKSLPDNLLQEIYDYILFLKQKNKNQNSTFTHLASENSLAVDWNKPQEDEAWKDL